MALSIKNPEADRLARELSEITGEKLTRVVIVALRERLRRLTGSTDPVDRHAELARLRREFAELEVVDDRSADEILGYDEHGLPH